MPSEQTTLLIVGAGPTGLSAANALLKHGFRDFVIVDQAPHRGEASRAMTVHAATLEALDTIGSADPLVLRGVPGKHMEITDRNVAFKMIDYTSLGAYTKYPYVLLVSQKDTEDYLEGNLQSDGITVQRGKKVVGLKNLDDGSFEVAFDSSETIVAKHIIGADGARSVIRQLSGIGFADPVGDKPDPRAHQLIIADVCFSGNSPMFPQSCIQMTLHTNGMFLIIPLPKEPNAPETERPYRIGFNLVAAEAPHDPPLEFLQKYLNEQGPYKLSSDPTVNPNPIHISKKIWATRFRTHSAIADQFFKDTAPNSLDAGKIMLLGDAAHIHSPAGGLGMNLGIRDAIGLAPFLTAYLSSATGASTAERKNSLQELQDYLDGRHVRAGKQIRFTKFLMGAMAILSAGGRFNIQFFQYWFLRFLAMFAFFRHRLAYALSGLAEP